MNKQPSAHLTLTMHTGVWQQVNTHLSKGHLFHTSSILRPSPLNHKNQTRQ